MRQKRWAMGVGAAAVAAAMTVTWVSAAQAGQGPGAEPEFVEPAELPGAEDLAWSALDPAAGLPDAPAFCIDGLLSEDDTWHREYQSDLDTNATQFVTRTDSAQDAAHLAAELGGAVSNCAAYALQDNPGWIAGWDDHGVLDAGDEARLFSVYTAPPQSGENVSAFGIGYVGDTVTVVHWGEMGTLESVPVEEFEPLLDSALNRLAN